MQSAFSSTSFPLQTERIEQPQLKKQLSNESLSYALRRGPRASEGKINDNISAEMPTNICINLSYCTSRKYGDILLSYLYRLTLATHIPAPVWSTHTAASVSITCRLAGSYQPYWSDKITSLFVKFQRMIPCK